MKNRLFRWYVGRRGAYYPIVCYPKGWKSWLRPSRWRSARAFTILASYDYNHGGKEKIERRIRSMLIYGKAVWWGR